jgi:protein-disulfide isomerase
MSNSNTLVRYKMKKRSFFSLIAFLLLALFGSLGLRAQDNSYASQVLRPPKGAKLALVVFEDLECPDCARAHPLIEEASKAYKIPVVRYDFPLPGDNPPFHKWSFDAAVMARYFSSKSPALGVAFKGYIFERQVQINGPNPLDGEVQKRTLRGVAEQFAKEHKTTLPFVVDPQGKFAADVRKDKNVGERVGITHTPTLYVVTDRLQGTPFVEVVDRGQLYKMIDELKVQQ